jgi:NAD(P) transhydrogenase subunit alpha
MKIGIPAETQSGERRVAATPDTIKKLVKMGFEVSIQAGAGEQAQYLDDDYAESGATVTTDIGSIWSDSELILKVNAPGERQDGTHEADIIRENGHIISLLFPAQNEELVARLGKRGVTALALDQIPRISRAQKMDVLSSMANIAGYRAIVEASNLYGGFFAGQMTAAGKTRPAQVLVIGAGVAGLAAIAAARGLGAEVRAFDVRPAVKDQVESLGAKFLELEFEEDDDGETSGGYAKTMSPEFIAAEMALFAAQAKEVNIIVTTALIPGRKAPVLITKEMVNSMKPGSVVVDLAAIQGGNCGYTEANKVIVASGVNIIGYTDLTSRLPTHASQFFGTNIVNLLSDMVSEDGYAINLEDEVIRKSLVLHNGEKIWPPPPDPVVEKPAVAPTPQMENSTSKKAAKGNSKLASAFGMTIAVAAMVAVGLYAEATFVQHLTVFILACFVGWQVVWNVTPALHTPLMSVTNAISGIIVVGGMLQAAAPALSTSVWLGALAILVASINIAGGFLVTQRMLQMFRKEAN